MRLPRAEAAGAGSLAGAGARGELERVELDALELGSRAARGLHVEAVLGADRAVADRTTRLDRATRAYLAAMVAASHRS